MFGSVRTNSPIEGSSMKPFTDSPPIDKTLKNAVILGIFICELNLVYIEWLLLLSIKPELISFIFNWLLPMRT